jgi:hypothetical protein
MSLGGVFRDKSALGLLGLAVGFCLVLSVPSFGADFDKKPTVWTIMGPSSKDALSEPPQVVGNTPPAPPSAGPGPRALPRGLPASSAAAKPVTTVQSAPPAPGPLGMKTPQPVVDATHQKPDYYPLLPGIYGRPDNNVGMVLGVVLPIESKDK